MRYWKIGIIGATLLSMPLAIKTVRAEQTASSTPLSALSTRKVSLEFKQVSAQNLFRLLGDIAEKKFRLDSCIADRRVDVRFQNAPLRLVVDAIGLQLGLVFREEGEWIKVSCE